MCEYEIMLARRQHARGGAPFASLTHTTLKAVGRQTNATVCVCVCVCVCVYVYVHVYVFVYTYTYWVPFVSLPHTLTQADAQVYLFEPLLKHLLIVLLLFSKKKLCTTGWKHRCRGASDACGCPGLRREDCRHKFFEKKKSSSSSSSADALYIHVSICKYSTVLLNTSSPSSLVYAEKTAGIGSEKKGKSTPCSRFTRVLTFQNFWQALSND